jgi:cytochrome b subunit of formate dehydrogenase
MITVFVLNFTGVAVFFAVFLTGFLVSVFMGFLGGKSNARLLVGHMTTWSLHEIIASLTVCVVSQSVVYRRDAVCAKRRQ